MSCISTRPGTSDISATMRHKIRRRLEPTCLGRMGLGAAVIGPVPKPLFCIANVTPTSRMCLRANHPNTTHDKKNHGRHHGSPSSETVVCRGCGIYEWGMDDPKAPQTRARAEAAAYAIWCCRSTAKTHAAIGFPLAPRRRRASCALRSHSE